jgi:glycosyltransferase involved in cell wall biosynthesis
MNGSMISEVLEKPALRVCEPTWQPGTSIVEQLGLTANQPRIAVLIPCHNEEAAIGKVVSDFKRSLPDATVYVYDNNSTDRTMLEARAAGAVVRRERLQGKGHVVRRMFADVDADIYFLVDGDDTYDAAVAPGMQQMLIEAQLDMVSAARYGAVREAYRPGHRFGNLVLSALVTWAFGGGITDLLSGYRVFSRRFVKSFPALASGFETETEFTIHALALHMPVLEVRANYRNRAAGTSSKLNTLKDGMRILRAILALIQHERPLEVFSLLALGLGIAGTALGIPVVAEFMTTGLVPRLPTALLATALVLLSNLSLTCGLILDAIARARKENKRLAYLAIPPLAAPE